MSVFKGNDAELVGRERGADRSLVAACANGFGKRTVLFVIAVAALAVTAVGGCAEAPWPQLKSIAWSPDSKHLLSGGYDGEVRVRDLATGKTTIVHRARTPFINTVQWSPDGQRLLAVTDQTIELLDTHGKEIVVIVASPPLQHESFPVFEFPIQIAFSPTGERLAVAGWRDGRVLVVDARSGQTERVFTDIPESVSSISWAPNGKQLVAGARDQTVRILDVEAGKEAGRMEVALSSGWVKVEASPDGKRLAWHGYLTDTWLRDIEKGSERRIVVQGGTQSVAWSPDGKGIAVLGLETLQLWNVEAGVEEKSLPVRRGVGEVLWSPDGQYVAAFSMFERGSIWNVRKGTHRTLPKVVSLAFSPDMRFIASGEEVKSFSRF
jgi:WD40 repeat protein